MKKLMIFIMVVALIALAGCSQTPQGTPTGTPEQTPEQTSDPTVEIEGSTEFGKVDPQVDEPIVSEETVLGDYTSEFLAKYVEGGSYYIVQNSIIDGVVTKVEIAVSGQKASEKVGTQVKIIDGDMLYYVIHDSKAILTSPVAMSMKEGFTDFINVKTSSEAASSLIGTGEEELQGEKFGYEEFKNADGTVAKYYYDDVTLRYVNITKSDGTTELIQVEKISKTIPEEMFKIPDGYVMQDISKME